MGNGLTEEQKKRIASALRLFADGIDGTDKSEPLISIDISHLNLAKNVIGCCIDGVLINLQYDFLTNKK